MVNVFGHQWLVDSFWTTRLVRTEVKINKMITIKFYQLRRRAPYEQPLLNAIKYKPKKIIVREI
jgi:hypothetical protein